MMNSLQLGARRRGATVPLFAVLAVPLLGMLAFSVDLGYIVLANSDLQWAADAAALAGAEKLQEFYIQYTLPGQTSRNAILATATTNVPGSPMQAAEQVASCNKAGGVPVTVRDDDISFGYTDAQGNYTTNYQSSSSGFPNSVTVITRRDRFSNNPLALFFGPVFGLSSKELTATATATMYSGDISSLQAIQGVKGHILPATLDMNIWQTFYQNGTSSDGTVHTAANGYPQLQVYPSPNAPGSFGSLDVGPTSNNVPVFLSSSNSGQTPNDISYFLSSNLLPVSVSSPKSWRVGSNLNSYPPIDYQSIMGQPYIIPLFQPVNPTFGPNYQAINWQQQNGTGSENGSGNDEIGTYAVVGLVGIQVSQADNSNGSMIISIQPGAIVDPTAVVANQKPAGTQSSQLPGTVITTFTSAKLTH
jgi:Flp pilus assembly protein TadG